MEFLSKLFRNNQKTRIAIAVFVVALLAFFAIGPRTCKAEQTLTAEVGSAIVRGAAPTVGLTLGFPNAGPVKTDYEFGVQLVGSSDYEGESQPNAIMVHAALVDGFGPFEMGLGLYGHNVDWAYNCSFGFHLLARYRFTEHLGLQWRHYSTAGSCSPNPGRDIISVGWRF